MNASAGSIRESEKLMDARPDDRRECPRHGMGWRSLGQGWVRCRGWKCKFTRWNPKAAGSG